RCLHLVCACCVRRAHRRGAAARPLRRLPPGAGGLHGPVRRDARRFLRHQEEVLTMKWLIGILAAAGTLLAAAYVPNLLDLPFAPPGDDPLLIPLPHREPGV